jgi:hypothetical protein
VFVVTFHILAEWGGDPLRREDGVGQWNLLAMVRFESDKTCK